MIRALSAEIAAEIIAISLVERERRRATREVNAGAVDLHEGVNRMIALDDEVRRRLEVVRHEHFPSAGTLVLDVYADSYVNVMDLDSLEFVATVDVPR